MNNLNCKPDDVCQLIAGPKNYGRVVQVKELVTEGAVVVKTRDGKSLLAKCPVPTWHIDGYVIHRTEDGCFVEAPLAADRDLRPLRKPGDDEQDLLLAPLPFDVARAEHQVALDCFFTAFLAESERWKGEQP